MIRLLQGSPSMRHGGGGSAVSAAAVAKAGPGAAITSGPKVWASSRSSGCGRAQKPPAPAAALSVAAPVVMPCAILRAARAARLPWVVPG